MPENGWLGSFVRAAVDEADNKRPGGEGVLARLSELMFIEVVRRYVESLPAEQTGWLAGLRDRHVGRALNLLHGNPSRAWTLDQLVKEVGLSRSSLVERFSHFVGQPPMQYLAEWRMQIAAGLLAQGSDNVARVAAAVGYESEAAFSRAFKKLVGMPPAAWRKGRSRDPSLQPDASIRRLVYRTHLPIGGSVLSRRAITSPAPPWHATQRKSWFSLSERRF